MQVGDLVKGTSYPHNGKMGIIIEHHWAWDDEEQGFLVYWTDGSRSDAGEYQLTTISFIAMMEVINENR
tara:strand:- start:233 stop:439 length:207 start_codon:yes stop_codon:yes gene_type:complete